MYTPNDYIIQTIRSNVPYNCREDAIAALNAFEGHRIGQQITLLYKATGRENNVSDVHCLIAMGIKDANECGASGTYSPDRWENKYYPNGPRGTEFYRIIADSAERNEQGYIIDREVPPSGDPDPQEIINSLSTTKVYMAGNQYTVLNPVRQEEEVEDPFEFKQLNSIEPVDLPPQADFLVYVSGTTVTISNKSKYYDHLQWEYSGANVQDIVRDELARLVYPQPGTYTITLTAYRSGYPESVCTKTITIQ